MDIYKSLQALCSVSAPSGFESASVAAARTLLGPLVDEVRLTTSGCLLGIKRCGKPDAKILLLDAHLDEIGLLVTGIQNGFLRFCSIGGVDPRMLPDREVVVMTDPPRIGVVSCLPPDLLKKADSNHSIPMTDMAIDVGLSHERAVEQIPLGTPVTYRGSCFPIGENRVCGKSMDDRSCYITLLRALDLLQSRTLDVDLYILGSTQEEVTAVGAKTAAFELKPDFCVAVDVTHGSTPDSADEQTFPLGDGAVIGVGPNMTRWMSDRMIAKAKEHQIPYHLEVMGGHSGTNGWYFQIAREGIPTAVLSLPLRYMHSPIEVLDKGDVEQVAQLLAAFAENLGEEAAVCE